MRVIFVNRFYAPELAATAQLLTDLARDLASAGADVTVLTSCPRNGNAPRDDRGVRVVRMRTGRSHGGSMFGRMLDLVGFYGSATWRMMREVRRGDVLVALTDPPLIGVAAWVIAGMKGARLVHWVQDIYPEVAIAVTGQYALGALTPMRNAAWRSSDQCIVLSREMAAVLDRAGVQRSRIAVIPNWAPAGLEAKHAQGREAASLRERWELKGKFVIQYSGNLGRVHELDAVMAAARHLKDQPRLAFVFVGHGAQRARLQAEAERMRLGNVRFIDPQPRDRLGATLGVGDLHLVTLRAGCESFVFPSKLYGIAAAGRPVLFVGPRDCELARLVAAEGMGCALPPDDPQAIAATIEQLAASPETVRQQGVAAEHFAAGCNVRNATTRWRDLLASVQNC